MSEKDLKLTDLDYATGDHHLQIEGRSSLSGYQTAAVSLHVHPCQGDDAHHGIFPGER